MNRWAYLSAMATAAVLWGCSGTDSDGSSDTPDPATRTGDAEDGIVVFLDADIAEIADSDVDSPDSQSVCPGGSGCPCTDHEDCLSGSCIETMDGFQCSGSCDGDEDCPKGFSCVSISDANGTVLSACAGPFSQLCRPCKTDEDCEDPYGLFQDKCIEHGPDGSFCGVPCTTHTECPAGFSCGNVFLGRDSMGYCVPETGPCPCTQKFASEGSLTDCHVENEFGHCEGERTCDQMCDAPVPEPETCNGEDEDCDGETDEDLTGTACELVNEIGTCPGVLLCLEGTGTCEGTYASKETCNGIDDDCNGLTDEGFPDLDGDGIADCVDEDRDGDTIPNPTDNCPDDPNVLQQDTDGDGDGDECDTDDDGDGYLDLIDNCPFLQNNQSDLDGDGKGDPCDEDRDGDGIPNTIDICPDHFDPLQADLDQDGIGDTCDDDIDGDGDPNDTDCGPMDSDVFHEQTETCNELDDNCVDGVDEEDAQGCLNFYLDGDEDGHGAGNPRCLCEPETAWSASISDDCDDGNSLVNPNAEEICNGYDDDCDDEVDEGHLCPGPSCTDGVFLPPSDCKEGACTEQAPESCDDDNQCTDDTCDLQNGCIHSDNDAPCRDPVCEDLVHYPEVTCSKGKCPDAATENCEDGNVCTDDGCDVALGCTHVPNATECEASECVDGTFFAASHCTEGLCPEQDTESCDDDNPCTEDTCNPVSGCMHSVTDGVCSVSRCEGLVHFEKAICSDGTCPDVDFEECMDDDPCTDDVCSPSGGCTHPLNSDPCSDAACVGLLFQPVAYCNQGTCPTVDIVDCDDGNDCTDDTCDALTGCANADNDDLCQASWCDGLEFHPATYCYLGACPGQTSVSCDDDNACTTDGCEAGTGCTHVQMSECCGNGMVEGDEQCDDGNQIDWDGCTECVSGESLVSDEPVVNQSESSMGTWQDGRFILAWRSNTSPDLADGDVIYLRRFEVDGEPSGPKQVVNVYTQDQQHMPDVATYPDGSFVVVWTSDGQDGSEGGIYGRRFGPAGSSAGNPFKVNAYTADNQLDPTVVSRSDGSFVVVWTSNGADGSGTAVDGRRFEDDGNPAGLEFRVNWNITGDQDSPTAALLPNDGYVVVFRSAIEEGTTSNLYAQRYHADGAMNGYNFRINEDTLFTDQYEPFASSLPDGRFLVAWMDESGVGTRSLTYRSFDAEANPEGSEHSVNIQQVPVGNPLAGVPGLAHSPAGRFIVVWATGPASDDGLGIVHRRFTAPGYPEDGELHSNVFTAGDQYDPDAAWFSPSPLYPEGGYVLSWTSDGLDGDGTDVLVRRYHWGGIPVTGCPTAGPACTGDQDCDDGNPCSKDVCNPYCGCLHTDLEGLCGAPSCNGMVYSPPVACQAGFCPVPVPVDCDDGDDCTLDSCVPESGCVHVSTEEECKAGKCVGLQWYQPSYCTLYGCPDQILKDCIDENACTNDLCLQGTGCFFQHNTDPCAESYCDGLVFYPQVNCSEGTCPTQNGQSCDDDDVCTDDACDPETGCVHTVNSVECVPAKCLGFYFHPAGFCNEGTCEEPEPVPCWDANPCTIDECDTDTGCWHDVLTGGCSGSCSDLLFSAPGDCIEGVCVHASDDCDDGNECTDDLCDPVVGCLHSNNTATCSGPGGCLVGGICSGGSCSGGVTDDGECDDGNPCTQDACNADGSCQHVASPGFCPAACIKGYYLTAAVCEEGTCQRTAVGCDDGNPCTIDSCDLDQGCLHVPVPALCWDGLICGQEQCDDGNVEDWDGCNDCQLAEAFVPSGMALYDWPSVGRLGDGRFLLVSSVDDGHQSGVGAQAYRPDGTEDGLPFLVNTTTWSDQSGVGLATWPTGSYVVVWQNDQQDPDFSQGISGQLFGNGGIRRDGEFHVNVYTTGPQVYPAVGAAPDGRFVVVWSGDGQDSDDSDVYARLFDADGLPDSGDILVPSDAEGKQELPTVGVFSDGAFVVVWCDTNTAVFDCFMRRFTADGSPLGEQSSATWLGNHVTSRPRLKTFPDGRFIMGFLALKWPNFDPLAVFQRYKAIPDEEGKMDGDPVIVGESYLGSQQHVGLDVLEDGRFVVVWSSQDNIYASTFDASGNPMSGDIQANEITGIWQKMPGVATFPVSGRYPEGGFVVAWHCQTVGDIPTQLLMQRFRWDGTRILSHGSEWTDCVTSADCDDGLPCTDDVCDPLQGCIYTSNDDDCDPGYCEGSNWVPPSVCQGGSCAVPLAEVCDDGNYCTFDECVAGVGCQYTALVVFCGDGAICGDEECEDLNGIQGDGCHNCQLE